MRKLVAHGEVLSVEVFNKRKKKEKIIKKKNEEREELFRKKKKKVGRKEKSREKNWNKMLKLKEMVNKKKLMQYICTEASQL